MSNIIYKCKDCQYEFTGDEYIMNCPVCNSLNIEKKEELSLIYRLKDFYSDRKIPIIALAFIITVISVLLLKRCNDEKRYLLKFNKYENYVQITIQQSDKDGSFKGSNIFSDFKRNFKVNNGEIQITDDGEIFPCKSCTLNITWDYPEDDDSSENIKNFVSEIKTSSNDKYKLWGKKKTSFTLKFDEINKKAECYSYYFKIRKTDSCRKLAIKDVVRIKNNLDTSKISSQGFISGLKISTKGIAGPFKSMKDSFIYMQNNEEYKIVGIYEGDTIKVLDRDGGMNTVFCSKVDEKKMKRLANNLIKNQLNDDVRNVFFKYVQKDKAHIRYYIDNKNISEPDLIDDYLDENKIKSVGVSSNNGLISIKFKSK